MVSSAAKRALLAGTLGWMLDGLDAMLYSFALVSIREEFHLTGAQVGALAALTLFTALGGVLFGIAADRVGRVRALSYSILTYSVFTALLATSHSLWELALWRALVGFGLGGEWAVGSALVAETWPAPLRGRAIGWMQSGWAIGYLLAAGISAVVLPRWGWRVLFALGILPALVTFFFRRSLADLDHAPRAAAARRPLRELFSPQLRRTTLLASLLATLVLFAYWGLFTWIPAFLATPVAKGGAGLGAVKSPAWVLWMQVGSFCGYASFGYLSDAFGRRPIFALFVIAAALSVGLYTQVAAHPAGLWLVGPLVGFFGHGYFSVFGALLSELFPASVRATALALCYNSGKAISAAAPIVIGFLADRAGVGSALLLTAVFFLASAIVIAFLPETRGRELQSI